MARTGTLRFDLDLRGSLDARLRPQALILQEDRHLVMAPPGTLDLDCDHDLAAAALAAASHRPLPLGHFVVAKSRNGSADWLYRAVVHDLENRPTCRPGDVRRSLNGILGDAVQRGIFSLVAEPLGLWTDGGLGLEGMVEAFDRAILETAAELAGSVRLTMLLDRMEQLEEASHLLRSRLLQRASRSFRTVSGDAAVVEVRWGGERLHFRFVPGTLSGYMVTRVAKVA